MKYNLLIVLVLCAYVVGCGGGETNNELVDQDIFVEDGDLQPQDNLPPDKDVSTIPGDDGNPIEPPTACLPPTGNDGVANISTGDPAILATISGQGQNLAAFNAGPMQTRRIGALARGVGSCDKAGVLFMFPGDFSGNTPRLIYQEITGIIAPNPTTEQEVVKDELMTAKNNGSLFFGDNCSPTVMWPTSAGYTEFVRDEGGIWGENPVTIKENGGINNLDTMAAWQHNDGTMKIIAQGQVHGDKKGFLGQKPIDGDSTWEFTEFDLPDFTELFSIKAAPEGTIHAVYSNIPFPCDPCDMGLYYGKLPPGGQWSEEIVQTSKWGAPNDEYALDGAIDIDSKGLPVIAATYMARAITGSTQSTELRLYGRLESGWCHEVIATKVDGFAASDGQQFTGVKPTLALDSADRPHIAFMDTAQWHDGQGWANAVNGQIRYAIRNGTQWTIETLLKQESPTEGKMPLYGATPPSLTASPDGKTVYGTTVAYEWDTDSIYLSAPADVTYMITAIQASTLLP